MSNEEQVVGILWGYALVAFIAVVWALILGIMQMVNIIFGGTPLVLIIIQYGG